MGDLSSSTTARPAEDRLDSWKEIAAYLNRDVTTVQRWQKREGAPGSVLPLDLTLGFHEFPVLRAAEDVRVQVEHSSTIAVV